MSNDSNTIKAVPIRLEFTEVERGRWKSQYSLNQEHFYIENMFYGYRLEAPERFFVQFTKHKTKAIMKAETFAEGERILQLIYRGKAAAIEHQIIFLG